MCPGAARLTGEPVFKGALGLEAAEKRLEIGDDVAVHSDRGVGVIGSWSLVTIARRPPRPSVTEGSPATG